MESRAVADAVTLLLAALVVLLFAAGVALAWWASGPRESLRDVASPGRLFVVLQLVLVGFGAVAMVLSGESHGAGPLLAAYGLLAFGSGAALTAAAVGVPRRPQPGATVGPVQPLAVAGLALVGALALASIAVVHGLPFLAPDTQASRAAYGGLVFDLFRWLVPPAALVAVAVAVARRERRDIVVAGALLAAVLAIELLLASRALPLELAFAALLLTWWAGRRLSRRAWLVLGGVALVLFVAVQLARVANRGAGFADTAEVAGFGAERTINRLFLIQPRTLEIIVETIPHDEPYFAGATYLRRITALIGGEPRPTLGYWLYERLFPAQPGGFAAPGVLGELWANGGPYLALPGMFALGSAAVGLGRFLARLGNGAADRVFAAVVVVAFARAYATSLNGLLLTLIVALVWRIAVTLPSWPAWLRVGGPRRAALDPAPESPAA